MARLACRPAELDPLGSREACADLAGVAQPTVLVGADEQAATPPLRPSLNRHGDVSTIVGPRQAALVAVGGALGDANHSGDISQPHAGVLSDARQDAGVVGEEAPATHANSGF